MAGDPDNAALWADADVYVGPVDEPNPADASAEFNGNWGLVGLLDGDEGFGYGREEQEDDHYAWGGILVRTSRRNFKQTVSFTALEDNATTRSLIWPGSSNGNIVVPRPVRIKIAFETREGGKVRRLISAYQAEVSADDWDETEGDLTSYPLVATIFPDTTESPAVLFVEQASDDSDDDDSDDDDAS